VVVLHLVLLLLLLLLPLPLLLLLQAGKDFSVYPLEASYTFRHYTK
jgi:hypothetical protein